jgi:hypothetical protein
MVVVTALGSSVEPIGGGSTYLIVVISARNLSKGFAEQLSGHRTRTLLLIYLHLDVEVYAGDYDVGQNVYATNAEQDVRVFERNLF